MTTSLATAAAVDDTSGATTAVRRLTRLRQLADHDPVAAAEDAWAWIAEAALRIRSNRSEALPELAALFAAGSPSSGIDGPTRGLLVGFVVQPGVDRSLAAITSLWMPWLGKRFDHAAGRGDNLLARSARWPAKLLWPGYRMRPADDRLSAFDFTTRIERGALDDTDVLVIDYAAGDGPVTGNPRLVIRSIRDELVELVPGVHLGKMLWQTKGGRRYLLAYFALRS